MADQHTSGQAGARDFFNSLGDPRQVLALLDHLPATYFFAKDLAGRFTHMNAALIETLGLKDAEDVIGRTDYDLFRPDVADAFRRQDDEVVTYGRSISGQVCSVPHAAGYLKWYVETKVALTEASGRPVGVAGVMYDLDRAGAILEPYQRLETAIRHIGDNYRESISIDELAALSHLSVSQFKRVFKDLFGISPHRYLTRVRLQAVRRLLLETTKTVDVIAAETGFFDASHLTRNFKKEVEMTPHAFRKQRHS